MAKKNTNDNYTQTTHWKRFIQTVHDYREIVGLVTTLASMAVALILYAISVNITPLADDISVNAEQIKEAKEAHEHFITREEFNLIKNKIDSTDKNVSLIYNYLLK